MTTAKAPAMHIKTALFKIARSRYVGYFIGFSFAHLTSWMPLAKGPENQRMIVFKHPVPTWETHWLGVPKKQIPSFSSLDLEDTDTQQTILAVYHGLLATAVSHHLPTFSILVNGGAYQDVPQLHFHLIAGPTTSGLQWDPERYAPPAPNADIIGNDHAIAYSHPSPARSLHTIITPKQVTGPLHKNDFSQPTERQTLTAVLQLAHRLITTHNPPAFRLQFNCDQTLNEPLTCHLLN